jgi:hypothetical protein
LDQRLNIIPCVAIETRGLPGGTVQFQYALTSANLMQAIDVLRDNASNLASRFPAGKNRMRDIRLGISKVAVHFAFLPPVFVTTIGASKKLIKVHSAILRPYPAGRAEIGDAAFGTDASTCEDHGRFRCGNPVSDVRNIHCG